MNINILKEFKLIFYKKIIFNCIYINYTYKITLIYIYIYIFLFYHFFKSFFKHSHQYFCQNIH